MRNTHSIAVLIGRWQLPHMAHLALLRTALEQADSVVVVITSAWRSRNPRNPFSASERQAMIDSMLDDDQRSRVRFVPVRDYSDERRWIQAVRHGVQAQAPGARPDIVLIGADRNESSRYLELFPDWRFLGAGSALAVRATALRDAFFSEGDFARVLAPYVHPSVIAYLQAWKNLPDYQTQLTEKKAVDNYKSIYTGPCYLTADCVLEVNRHVLLIRRGGTIGHGQWALPGGFVDPHETFYQAALRELAEETSYKPMKATMDAALLDQAVFDDPIRSPRGRLVTTAFYFRQTLDRLPDVRGQDDAKQAAWWPVAQLSQIEDELFEDHALILDRFIPFMDAAAAHHQ
ncbi:NUDIX domain-containing protein [Alcaligenes sp. SDU_A2]|uniref:NUDIX domain-containing protein n=1 Tax=Alcaligenes sp. SDU_A2 TaxID=3136634 RepID=UPI00311FE0E1